MNNTKHTHTILDGPDTKGGSVQHVRALFQHANTCPDPKGGSATHLRALCELLETHRPDIIIYENVTELMDMKPDG